jgi:acyl-CoA thioester hydrolase
MSEPDAGYRFPVHPRNIEVDQRGTVFPLWYLAWFDEAMVGYLRQHGLDYPQEPDVQISHAELDWVTPVRYGDRVEIAVDTVALGRTSFTLGFEVFRDGEAVCRGRTVYIASGPEDGGPAELPPRVRETLAEA